MSRPSERTERRAGVSPEIIGLRQTVTGTYVSLRCGTCGNQFECYQPAVAGCAVGEHICPRCSAACVVWAEDFDAAVARLLPDQSLDAIDTLTEEATRIAETWHRPETLARLLTYRGVPLGPATERELLAFITHGLSAARDGSTD